MNSGHWYHVTGSDGSLRLRYLRECLVLSSSHCRTHAVLEASRSPNIAATAGEEDLDEEDEALFALDTSRGEENGPGAVNLSVVAGTCSTPPVCISLWPG